ncbi:MAG: gamma-glutamylcyclotransferase [Hyphomicrobium sp.]|uniref:gamma-glutamylcyclotransferase family protein n=1 Tax=Hyphomicrobium sp. TaxID=82 RepID=UPI001321A88C|nr:gamma-glutamylcyclotransferase family protein [Hyphomicrobium sp.]KAB2942244.1 MAG: gamma-glutamylcyclotransferase [Hyphomicrobium sp.]MBZ0208383.1 gamma-glutamylcyclotransferase [Hyphomicrobium sp.]
MTDPDCRYLFVYGTLMSGARSVLGRAQRLRLARQSDGLGPASLPQARLYDLGRYPGAAPSNDIDDIVHGEAVLLSNPHAALRWLDEYEGYVHGADHNEYDRTIRQVRLAGGETFDAWVYMLRAAPDARRRLASGRWTGR